MVAALIIATIGILALGYVLMDKIDGFMQINSMENKRNEETSVKVLLLDPVHSYGKLAEQLKLSGTSLQTLNNTYIPEGMRFQAAIALSKSDMDNMLLCTAAKHMQPYAYTMALCNNPLYMDVFKSTGIDFVFAADVPEELIYVKMKGYCDECSKN